MKSWAEARTGMGGAVSPTALASSTLASASSPWGRLLPRLDASLAGLRRVNQRLNLQPSTPSSRPSSEPSKTYESAPEPR